MTGRRSQKLSRIGGYLTALLLCLLVVGSVFDLRSETRQFPWAYRGDTMFYQLIVKSVTESGWFLDVPLLRAPRGMNLREVPNSDNSLHVLILRLLALGTSNYPSVLNTFFLLSFPLIFMSALVVMRHFQVGWPASVCASLLYAFAPFHFTRGEHHLFLSAYWQVPLATMVALWVGRERPGPPEAATSARLGSRLWLSVAICIVLTATGFYYAFFACFFLLVAGTMATVRERTSRGLGKGAVLTLIIATGLAVNLSPSLTYFAASGTPGLMQRESRDAEQYGLRIAQLVLPVSGHRLSALEVLKTDYNRRPMVNENDHASLGLAGAIGFLGLIAWFFFHRQSADTSSDRDPSGLLHDLSAFNLAGVMLGTMGGFGSLVAFFGLPQVRAYNRISVFLSFFALFALALWLDAVLRRFVTSRRRQVVAYVALATVTMLALGDQIGPRMLPDYKKTEEIFSSDAAFIRAIEAKVPHGASIFQLPFMTFPESPAVSRMMDYDLLRGYLHSSHLRWTYGTVKGREGNAWLRQVAGQPVDQLVETLVWAGFSGIYVDRNGFADNGEKIEGDLHNVLQDSPIHSADHQRFFYDLASHRDRLEQRTPPSEWAERREAALNPLLTVWRTGFYDEEGTPENHWRWAGPTGRIELINGGARTQEVDIDMTVVGSDGGEVAIRTPLLREPIRLTVNPRGQTLHQTLVLPPGRHAVDFESSAERLYPPNDFRNLVFSVHNFRVTPLSRPTSP